MYFRFDISRVFYRNVKLHGISLNEKLYTTVWQLSYGKVMFSFVCICHSVHREGPQVNKFEHVHVYCMGSLLPPTLNIQGSPRTCSNLFTWTWPYRNTSRGRLKIRQLEFNWNGFLYLSHFAYACKMRYLLNLVLENIEYLWFYWTFCIVILDYGLELHNLLIHTLVMLQKWLEIH